MNTTQQQLTTELSELRLQALLQTVSEQRNSALNDAANQKAEVAVLTRALQKQAELNATLTENVQLLQARLAAFTEEKPVDSPKEVVTLPPVEVVRAKQTKSD